MKIELNIEEKNIILNLLQLEVEGYELFMSGEGAEEEIQQLKNIIKKMEEYNEY